MKKFKLNFNLEAWIAELEIEAETEEEAIEQLTNMDLLDIVQQGYDKEVDIRDIESELIEAEYTIQVDNITYDEDEYNKGTAEYPFRVLPKSLTIEICWNENKSIEEEIESEIYYELGCYPLNYTYKILNK